MMNSFIVNKLDSNRKIWSEDELIFNYPVVEAHIQKIFGVVAKHPKIVGLSVHPYTAVYMCF